VTQRTWGACWCWLPGDAPIEFVGRFELGQRIVLVLLVNVAAPRYRNTRLSALAASDRSGSTAAIAAVALCVSAVVLRTSAANYPIRTRSWVKLQVSDTH
jgi:hypothetical protein